MMRSFSSYIRGNCERNMDGHNPIGFSSSDFCTSLTEWRTPIQLTHSSPARSPSRGSIPFIGWGAQFRTGCGERNPRLVVLQDPHAICDPRLAGRLARLGFFNLKTGTAGLPGSVRFLAPVVQVNLKPDQL